jgi:hypothetical protein
MFSTRRNAVADPPNPWKVPTNTEARESVKRRSSRGAFLIGVLSSAALVATFLAIGTSASASSTSWQLADGSAQKAGAVAGFQFQRADNTRLLYTDKDQTLLNNDSGKTIAAGYTISGVTGTFTYYGEGTASNPCGTPATVRVYFESIPPGTKFAYTNYWWADLAPASAVLANGTVALSINIDATQAWSDWNGQPSSTSAGAFSAAAGNVTAIGLSFGGGCFFENGVGTTDSSGAFSLDSFTVS